MRVVFGVNERACLSQEINYHGVGFEHLQSGKPIDVLSETSRVINRTIDLSSFQLSG